MWLLCRGYVVGNLGPAPREATAQLMVQRARLPPRAPCHPGVLYTQLPARERERQCSLRYFVGSPKIKSKFINRQLLADAQSRAVHGHALCRAGAHSPQSSSSGVMVATDRPWMRRGYSQVAAACAFPDLA